GHAREARFAGQRSHRRHHRPRHAASRPDVVRAGAHRGPPRRHDRGGPGRHRLAPPGRRHRRHHRNAHRHGARRSAGAGGGMRFTYEALPARVVFGVGSIGSVADELAPLGVTRVFLIADAQAKSTADDVTAALGPALAPRWDDLAQHVPVELAERARAAAVDSDADVVVCIGGGSSTGLAKAVALTTRLPILAVPTTYAGSEMTPIYGLTGRHKQ